MTQATRFADAAATPRKKRSGRHARLHFPVAGNEVASPAYANAGDVLRVEYPGHAYHGRTVTLLSVACHASDNDARQRMFAGQTWVTFRTDDLPPGVEHGLPLAKMRRV